MEICEISGLPIPLVIRLHQSNGYSKRMLRVWRAQKCNALVGAETVLTSMEPQNTPFDGGSTGPRMEICETSGLPIPMVPHLHQSNGYITRKLRVSRAQKCNALLSAETVLTSAVLQSTPFDGGQYRTEKGNMRYFGPTNLHGTAFAPKQWLYQKEATCTESSKT